MSKQYQLQRDSDEFFEMKSQYIISMGQTVAGGSTSSFQ
jgi:hypothetical protein